VTSGTRPRNLNTRSLCRCAGPRDEEEAAGGPWGTRSLQSRRVRAGRCRVSAQEAIRVALRSVPLNLRLHRALAQASLPRRGSKRDCGEEDRPVPRRAHRHHRLEAQQRHQAHLACAAPLDVPTTEAAAEEEEGHPIRTMAAAGGSKASIKCLPTRPGLAVTTRMRLHLAAIALRSDLGRADALACRAGRVCDRLHFLFYSMGVPRAALWQYWRWV
jgi:hypothetical protein